MKILITNDDGISSKLILLLYKELSNLGFDTDICVPDKNNSAISQAIRFWEYKENKITKVKENIYTHPGTPADGINYYLMQIGKPDLVISGVNIGLNAGIDVQYSGTIGAASEAINHGIPAIALSAGVSSSEENIVRGIKIILEKVFKNNLYSTEFIYSFNIPNQIIFEDIILCPLNKGIDYMPNKNYGEIDSSKDVSSLDYVRKIGKHTDLYFLNKGTLTITPISVDRTFYEKMSKIADFFDK